MNESVRQQLETFLAGKGLRRTKQRDVIIEAAFGTHEHFNADDLHEWFKRHLLPPRFLKVRGEELKVPASTTDLDKVAFGEYLDKICALTGVPLPDPIAAGYLPH